MRAKLLLGLCVVSAVSVARAQDDDAPAANKVTPSVFVRDSGLATEKLALAAKLEKQKNWTQAADVYQDIATKYADRVIASKTGPDGQPSQYVSVAEAVQGKLARWPAEGLAAYRKRFEDAARDQLNAADPADTVAARRVMSLYFVTDAGRDAAMRLQAAAFERGDFSAAAYLGRRLLDEHPDVVAERPHVLMQTALAEHLAGKNDAAAKDADELKTRFADSAGRIAGQDVKLASALAADLATPALAAGAYRSDDWLSPFGTPEANAVPAAVSPGGAKLFSVELPAVGRRNLPQQRIKEYQQRAAPDRQSGVMTGIYPAIDGGDLFFQDNARVYAVSLSSGQPLPGWAATYPGAANGAFAINALPTPRGKQLTVNVAGDRVVALLGQFDLQAAMTMGVSTTPPQLVCLDRNSGKRLWSVTPQRLGIPDDLAGMREGAFYGGPLVVGNTVYVPVHATRGEQFDECYVLALNLADGGYKWAAYVASTSLGNRFNNFEGQDVGGTSVAQLSASGGRLYVATNLGAVACLDGGDGRVLWLNVYPQQSAAVPRRFPGFFTNTQAVAQKPFAVSPPVVDRGRVFVLPSDGHDLLVYDALNGNLLRALSCQFSNANTTFAPADMLLAVVGDTVVLANKSTLFRVPWQSYDKSKSLVQNGGMYKSPPGADSDNPDRADALRGRPFVSGRDILVTTPDQLHRITLDSFRTSGLYPAGGKWDDDESPGNVVATADHLVIAGPTRITAYADLGLATAKLDQQIAAGQGDAEPYFRYAELMFAANRPAEGLAKLDAAADRLGGRAALRPGPARDRLFAIALAAAVKQQKADNGGLADQLFDRVAAAADAPAQQVQYRLSRAAYDRQRADAAGELALQQQILFKPEWRAAPAAGAAVGSTGGSQAEAAVADLVKQYGAQVYAPYESAAAAKLDELSKAADPDPDALVAIADEYPAFSRANDALTQAADRYEQAGRYRPATQTLRRLLSKKDLSNERQSVALQGLARADLLTPTQTPTAIARLRDAASLAPSAKLIKPLTLSDGRTVDGTVAEAADKLVAYAKDTPQQALPTFGPLTPPRDASGRFGPVFRPAAVVGVAAAIVPQQADLARYDRLVTVGLNHEISVIDTATAQVQPTDAPPDDAPLGCAYTGGTGARRLLVLVSPGRVVGITPAGKTAWSFDVAGLPRSEAVTPTDEPSANDDDNSNDQQIIDAKIERQQHVNVRRVRKGLPLVQLQSVTPAGVTADPGNGPERFTALFRVLSDRVVLATSTGRLVAVDLAGRSLWQTRLGDQPAVRMVGNDDYLGLQYGDAGQPSDVYALDAVTGRPVLHRAYDGTANPQAGDLVNLAMSPDGVLVTLLKQRVVSHDLYAPDTPDADHHLDLGNGRPNLGDAGFRAGDGDGQLVISGDTVLAVYHATGSGAASVWACGLRSMKLLTVADDADHSSHQVTFSPQSNDREEGQVTIYATGPSVYVLSPHALAGYRLDYPASSGWALSPGAGDRGPGVDLLLARDLAVLVAQQGQNNPAATKVQALRLYAIDRTLLPDRGTESGRTLQYPIISDPAAILSDQWHLADHALYYVSGDQKLKVLRVNAGADAKPKG